MNAKSATVTAIVMSSAGSTDIYLINYLFSANQYTLFTNDQLGINFNISTHFIRSLLHTLPTD